MAKPKLDESLTKTILEDDQDDLFIYPSRARTRTHTSSIK